MTNFDYLQKYLVTLELEGYSNKTIKIYNKIIYNFLSIFSKSISDISTSDIRTYLINYKDEHLISNVTLSNYQHYISSFFNWLVKEGILETNPCANLRSIKTPKIIKEGFSDKEMTILRENCITKREKALVEVLYCTGLRVSELVSLNINDIDWINHKCKVVGKGAKEREVYFSNEAISILKEYLKSRKDNNEALFVTMTKPFNRITIATVEKILKDLGKRCSIHAYPHRFRHTCATNLLNQGMPVQDVSKILGHSKIDTTMIYCSLDKEKIKNEYDKIMNR